MRMETFQLWCVRWSFVIRKDFGLILVISLCWFKMKSNISKKVNMVVSARLNCRFFFFFLTSMVGIGQYNRIHISFSFSKLKCFVWFVSIWLQWMNHSPSFEKWMVGFKRELKFHCHAKLNVIHSNSLLTKEKRKKKRRRNVIKRRRQKGKNYIYYAVVVRDGIASHSF